MENTKVFRIDYAAISIIFAAGIVTSAEILAANVVYVATEAKIGSEVVTTAEQAVLDFVITESELDRPKAFVDAEAGATLGLTTNASSGSYVDPDSAIARGVAKAGWTATFQANGTGLIDLDFHYRGFAELASSIVRPQITATAVVSFMATLETRFTSVNLFNGSAELRSADGLDAVLTEEFGFAGLGVISIYDLPRSSRAEYSLDMVLEDVMLLSPNEKFTISIEASTATYFSENPFSFYDRVTSEFSGSPTLLSSNGSASFTLVPISSAFVLFAPACVATFRRRRSC